MDPGVGSVRGAAPAWCPEIAVAKLCSASSPPAIRIKRPTRQPRSSALLRPVALVEACLF